MSAWPRDPAATLRHGLGTWLVYRKLASIAHLPEASERLQLRGKRPTWYVINFNLAARQTGEYSITPGKRFWPLAILGSSMQQQAGSFRAQIYDARQRRVLEDRPVNFRNLAGTPAQPAFLRHLYEFGALSPIFIRVQNLETAGNTGQVILYGMSDTGKDIDVALDESAPATLQPLPGLNSPSVVPPPSRREFNYIGYVAIPALNTEAVVVTFQVPLGMNGVIKWIGNNFVGGGWVEGGGVVNWRLERDGCSVPEHENITCSLGNPAAPSETAPIRVHEGETVALIVRNNALGVAGQTSGGRLSGWFYPLELEDEDVWL